MRPIPVNSTDVLYSAFPLEEMTEIAHAHNASNINFITKACLTPQRALYHSCVNNVCAMLHSGDSLDEVVRGNIIADRADAVYSKLKDEFSAKLAESKPELDRKYDMVRAFMDTLEPEQHIPWDKAGFTQRWATKEFPFRWQRKALETYTLVRENIENGNYTPSAGWDALRVTHYWSDRNLEYKHHRDLARSIVQPAIRDMFPGDTLKYLPSSERDMSIVTGGMGTGKSTFTDSLWSGLSEEDKRHTVVHDADLMKIAFGRSAVRDGKIASFSGPEIQNESSIALYENCRKRHYMARSKDAAPDVIINSTVAGKFELSEGLEGGGGVKIYHLSIDPDEAWESIKGRAYKTKRLPDEESVRWSIRASTQNLLTLADYPGAKINTMLYNRKPPGGPELVASWDIRDKVLCVHDAQGFFELASRAELAPRKEDAIRRFMEVLLDKGVAISFLPAKGSPLVKLSVDRNLDCSGEKMPPLIQGIVMPIVKSIAYNGLPVGQKLTKSSNTFSKS